MTAVNAQQTVPYAEEVYQDIGGIVEADAESRQYKVETDDGTFHAQRAVSCLVEPELGDRVLFAGQHKGTLYILGILEREGTEARRLSVPEGVVITSKNGRVAIAAPQVDLVSSKELTLTSKDFQLRAAQGLIFLENLSYLGTRLSAELEQVKTVAGHVESVAERVVQRAKRAYRFVEEMDQVRANAVDYAARALMRFHGDNVVGTAKKLVKFDGEQIHLG